MKKAVENAVDNERSPHDDVKDDHEEDAQSAKSQIIKYEDIFKILLCLIIVL